LMAVCVFTFGNKVSAQGTFFEFVSGWSNNYSVEADNSYELVGLNDFEPFVLGDHFIQFVEINTTGQIISEQEFSIDTTEFLSRDLNSQSVLSYGAYLYLASQSGFLGTNTVYGCLLRYNRENSEIELIKVFNDDISNYLFTLALKNDTSILIGGYQSNNAGTTSLFLHETDLAGEPRWTYTTECGNNCYNYAEHILPLDNGNTVLLYREWDYEIGNQDKERAVLVMIDPLGEELWRAYPGNDEGYKILPGGVVLQDGELLVCFTDPYVYETNGDWVYSYDNTVHLETYSIEGVLTNEQSFLYDILNSLEIPRTTYEVTQLQYLSDGAILISGTTGPGGLLMKIQPNGELIWFREILQHPLAPIEEGYNQDLDILHVLETSDGGLLCTGMFRSNPSEYFPQGIQTAFALKVDEYGCLEEGCEITSAEELSITLSSPIKVWPNPVTGNEFTLESQVDLHIASIVLVDMQGRRFSIEVEHGNQLRSGTSSAISCDRKISSGLYTLLITTSEGVAYSLKLVFEE
jgi:hypothetical protein